jgi:hypothetical protein
MSEPTYPAARLIAEKLQGHFSQQRDRIAAAGEMRVAPVPDPFAVERMIDTAFWASLRREEGREPRISLAWVPPEQAGHPLRFASSLPLRPGALARLAPAVERAGIHLGVWPAGDEANLEVWGTTRSLPAACFVIEVVASGVLVIKQSGEPFGKFLNVAVLEGDQVKFVDEDRAFVPGCPDVVKSLLGRMSPSSLNDGSNLLVQVAASMRRHGRGGALLVVPEGTSAWRESIVSPMLYGLEPPFSELSSLLAEHDPERDGLDWQDALRQIVDAVGGLTAVDGATIISSAYDVLAFGAKITRRRDNPGVERLLSTEPIEGAATTYVSTSQLGGTRHLSAAQFVHDQRDAVALVASQDGRFTVFQWSPVEQLVHAHRVEALLL